MAGGATGAPAIRTRTRTPSRTRPGRDGGDRERRPAAYPQSCFVASFAPSARAWNFAQITVGWTSV